MNTIPALRILFGILLTAVVVLGAEPSAKLTRLEQPKAIRGWCDTAPQKYPDLMPQYREVPDALNAVPLLLKAKSSLVGWDEMRQKKNQYQRGKEPWDVEYWDKMIKKNQKAQQLIHQAAQKPWLQIPFPESPASATTGLMVILNLIKFQEIRVTQSLKKGQLDEAMKQAELAMSLSQKTLMSDSGLIGLLVGIANYQASLQMCESIVQHPKCQLDHLQRIEKWLKQVPRPEQRCQEAFKGEFLFSMKWIGGLYTGRLHYTDLTGGLERDGADAWIRDVMENLQIHLALQPNRTFKLHAESMRYGILLAATPRWKRAALPKPPSIKFLEQDTHVWSYLSPNGMGKFWLSLATPSLIRQCGKIDEFQLRIRSIQMLCALRKYHLKYGTLPNRLEKLVPDFIQKIPTDPYDGKNLRYSMEKKRFWSVGEDGLDHGGLNDVDSLTSFRKMKQEPTFLIQFAETN